VLSIEQIVRRTCAFPAKHVVITGGEPMIMPDIVPLTDELNSIGFHITIETAATKYQPVRVNLASLSPKLSNSTPWQREGGRFAESHERQRLDFATIQQFIDRSPEFQLKFVVTTESDLAEIEAILTKLTGWQPADVLLMPEGVDAAALNARAGWISEICKNRGFRFCPRLHVLLYGNKRGT